MNAIEPLVSVRNLRKEFPIRKGVLSRQVGAVKAVNDVSFDVARGETLGVVGESGCGKTTTGRAILRLIEPTSGEIRFEGRDVRSMGTSELRALRREFGPSMNGMLITFGVREKEEAEEMMGV